MFAASVVYTIVNRIVVPPQKLDTYRMYFDAEMLNSLRKYLQWSVGADRYGEYRGFSPGLFYTAEAVVGLALAVFAVVMLRRRRWLAAFCIGWFAIVIAPVLPLKRHVSDYYVTVPVIGLAILGAWGVSLARGTRRILAAVVVLVYVVPSVWMAQGMSRQFYSTSRRIANFVRSVAYAHRQHPEQRLLIRNMDDTLFWVRGGTIRSACSVVTRFILLLRTGIVSVRLRAMTRLPDRSWLRPSRWKACVAVRWLRTICFRTGTCAM